MIVLDVPGAQAATALGFMPGGDPADNNEIPERHTSN